MKERSSFRERAKFSRSILRSTQRILRSPMPNEHADLYKLSLVNSSSFSLLLIERF